MAQSAVALAAYLYYQNTTEVKDHPLLSKFNAKSEEVQQMVDFLASYKRTDSPEKPLSEENDNLHKSLSGQSSDNKNRNSDAILEERHHKRENSYADRYNIANRLSKFSSKEASTKESSNFNSTKMIGIPERENPFKKKMDYESKTIFRISRSQEKTKEQKKPSTSISARYGSNRDFQPYSRATKESKFMQDKSGKASIQPS
jgi:hypothetical protein